MSGRLSSWGRWLEAFAVVSVVLTVYIDRRTQASLDASPALLALQREAPAAPIAAASDLRVGDPGFPGVFLLGKSVDLTFRVEARVQAVQVVMGQPVMRGQVLAQIDATALVSELAVVTAQLEVARAEAARISEDVKEASRFSKSRAELRRESVISSDEFDVAAHRAKQVKRQLRVALARAAEADAHIQEVRQRLRETEIEAPFDGVIGECFVDAGATIGPDKPILRIISTALPRIRFAVPEDSAPDLVPGLPLAVSMSGSGQPLNATVTHVAPELNFAARMLFAEAELDAPLAGGVYGGRSVRVRLSRVPR